MQEYNCCGMLIRVDTTCTCWRSAGSRMLCTALNESGELLYSKIIWPSGLRRWRKAPFRKGVGSNPTGVTVASPRPRVAPLSQPGHFRPHWWARRGLTWRWCPGMAAHAAAKPPVRAACHLRPGGVMTGAAPGHRAACQSPQLQACRAQHLGCGSTLPPRHWANTAWHLQPGPLGRYSAKICSAS